MLTHKSWYTIRNASPAQKTVDIHIIDLIGGWNEDLFGDSVNAKTFVDDLGKLPASIQTIRLHVNSPGGDVFAALNIANALREQRISKKRTVDVFVDGLAASSASIVIMAGNTIRIADNALVMIHNPWTFSVGDAKNMREVADRLDKIRETIVATYRWQTSMSASKISALMDATTWMDADEAVKNGFATEKIQGLKVAASFDQHAVSKFGVPPRYRTQLQHMFNLDLGRPAASGTGRSTSSPPPGASGSRTDTVMNASEGLTQARAELQTKSARLEELMTQDDTEGGLEAELVTERDTLATDVKNITAKIGRLSALEAAQAAQAAPVYASNGPLHLPAPASRPRIEVVKKEFPKGTLFTRYMLSVAAGKGSFSDTLEYSKQFRDTPEVAVLVKSFMGRTRNALEGTASGGSPSWGSELVNPNTAMTQFVELLMPETIIGKVTGFDTVPFNIPIIEQTGGSTFEWVNEGKKKPVGELSFDRNSLGHSKCAGIIVLTDELVRLSVPSAEAKARQDMIKQCRKFLDEQFIQVAVTAGTESPASITNGAPSSAASGTDIDALRRDLMTALAVFTAAQIPLSGLAFAMTSTVALGISMLTDAFGQSPQGFNVTPQGGTLLGYPVIVSDSVDAGTIVIFKPSEIFLADDGDVRIDSSNQATLDMGDGETVFNLWQRNCLGLRAERWINWQKKRANVVAVITDAAYGPAAGSPA